ncbi:MAG: hypothetical protein Q8P18_13625 [Pseudomonadota bacterium]|nr:hypothetical protein [Pseudomonadota bacterium]
MLTFPHATSPRVLTRLLEQVAAGHRRQRALGEVLGIEAPVLRSYLLAASWLRLLDLDDEPTLTRAGLAYVYAGARRPLVLAATIAAHPVLGPLGTHGPIGLDELARAVSATDPSLAPRTVRKRALALRRLLGPGLRPPVRVAMPPPADLRADGLSDLPASERSEPARAPEQLSLGFASDAAPPPPPLDLRAGADDNPDVYTHLLRALLDHGELDPHQVRGLLDAAGGTHCGIGGYLAMATRRGDATRVGDVLVVSAGAAARRELAESPVSVALSDPDFRRHLGELLAGRPGDARRFRPWMNRLFQPGTVEENLERLLFGRRLASFPLAEQPGEPTPVHADPFLASTDRRGLVLAFPSTLGALAGGLGTVNQLLRGARQGTVARPPHALDRRVCSHGGLVHPGEPPVRVVPDMVSLRARALKNVPAFAILAALGLLDRRGVLELRVYGPDVLVQTTAPATGSRRPRRLDAVVDALGASRGWVIARSPTGPSWTFLAEIAESLGLVVTVGSFLTLDETLFRKLGTDPEHRDLLDGLEPLAEHLAARLGRR